MMESRWSDTDTSSLDDLDLLVYQSRLIGADPSLVVWGGGNTSLKVTEQDFRGRETKVLRVKGSGSDMKSIQRQDFPALRMDDLLTVFERADMTDDEMVEYQTRCLLESNSPRPSIETLLHAFLPFTSVAHSHADAILSLTNNTRAKEVLTTGVRQGYCCSGIPAAGVPPFQGGGSGRIAQSSGAGRRAP